MVKFVQSGSVLAIRNEVLREGKLSLEECRYPSDEMPGAFHLGFYINEELVCTASFHPQSYQGFNGSGYQLRGMATVEKYRGNGFGGRVVNFAVVYLKEQKIDYLWCNARKKALQFYRNAGFKIISGEFEVAGIGPHFVMILRYNEISLPQNDFLIL